MTNHRILDMIMKKILLLMAIVALPLVFISCGDDKDEPTAPDGHQYVDLGLPSGTLWATCNIGANSPEEYGDYFAWGETVPKAAYEWSTYKWCEGNYDLMTKYCNNYDFGTVDNKTVLELEDDAAHVNWGASWRVPTNEQLEELRLNCTWLWTTKNGVNGCKVIGPNGATLFLPAAGRHTGSSLEYADHDAFYWSRSLTLLYEDGYGPIPTSAFILGFDQWTLECNIISRPVGITVRAVYVPQH